MKSLLVILLCGSLVSGDIPAYFGKNYNKAVSSIQKDQPAISSTCKKLNVPEDIVESIVFPEYLRSNIVSGLLEEKSLETIYVQEGSNSVDFSIGKFQIKPSFAEKIEALIDKNEFELKSKYSFLLIDKKSATETRTIRVQRLKNQDWQTRYTCAFVEYGLKKLEIQNETRSQQIKYLATMYNCGLEKTKNEIENMFGCQCFPYGESYEIDQVNYWEVSQHYYQNKNTKN